MEILVHFLFYFTSSTFDLRPRRDARNCSIRYRNLKLKTKLIRIFIQPQSLTEILILSKFRFTSSTWR